MEQQWRLGEFVIEQYEDGMFGWCQYGKFYPDKEEVDILWGKAFIEEDCNVLLLTPWKVHDTSDQFKTLDEVSQFLNTLPQWDKTIYFLKRGDIGHTGLVVCNTLDPASNEVHDKIMPKLGFVKAHSGG